MYSINTADLLFQSSSAMTKRFWFEAASSDANMSIKKNVKKFPPPQKKK